MTDNFLKDILTGLKKYPKTLPSMYFYNTEGSKLFQMIMKLPEYYLTRSEYEILDTYSKQIYNDINPSNKLKVIEFGAGDGSKTKLLLEEFLKFTTDFTYSPIDISKSALEGLESSFKKQLPKLKMNSINDDYFSALENLKSKDTTILVLFLGSNIGNFKDEAEISFLINMRKIIAKGDYVLIGFDLKKDPAIILDAYNDKTGITRMFNLNLIQRINTDLGANFDIESFSHYPTYNPITGEAKSYLISLKKQSVNLGGETIDFEYGEPIFMEVSKKYSVSDIEDLAAKTGFRVEKNYQDCRNFFLDSLWVAK